MVRLVPFFFWLVIWGLLSVSLDLKGLLLPDLFSTAADVVRLILNVQFLSEVGLTVLRVLPGIAFSVAIGVPLGLALAASRRLRLVGEPLFSFFRGVPVATLFPVAIILFGIGDIARVVLTVYVALPIVVVATTTGAIERSDNKTRRDYIHLHRGDISWWHLPMCLLWDALPSILGGLKIAVALSLVVIIVSEMFFVGGSGAGWYIWDQYQSFNLSRMYASILIVGALSALLTSLIDVIQTRVIR